MTMASSPMSGNQQSGSHSYPASNSSSTMCLLAPGAMGAAHQLAMSAGYSNDCPGMPGQQSPYMWPLRWSADVEAKGLKFGSDEVQYHSKGRVMYMLDKNWKRLDNFYQVGIQRTVGQGPCDQADSNSSFGCVRNSTTKSTIIHRNNRMSFIDYHENGSISSCRWMDLSIIGNIRPDWFMDDRGDSTDVQYLGDSHVFYRGEPKLVKQWRKKDFANQYFTMSMQRLPGADGMHWPLILNVPGEGFGDDFLQHYSDHKTLGESDSELFLIDDAFVEAGGSCPKMASEGSAGPPTGQQAHVPSNLEVQKQSWRSIVWTESPIWIPVVEVDMSTAPGVLTVTSDVSVESCFKDASSMLKLNVKIKMETMAWAAISWRETEECLMTPRGGGDAEVVWANPKTDGTYSLHFGPLSPSMKKFDASAMGSFMGKLSPLQDLQSEFGMSSAEYKDGELHFSFERKQPTKPGMVYLNFAFGTSGAVGYHKSRGCFELSAPPACTAEKECPVCKDCSTSASPASPTPESMTDPATPSSVPSPVSTSTPTSSPTASPVPAPAPSVSSQAETSSSSGRSLGEKMSGGGAVLTAFGLGAMLR